MPDAKPPMLLEGEEQASAWLREEFGEAAFQKLNAFVEVLKNEANRQNLISSSTKNEIWRRHIADSAQLVAHVSRETSPWLDLGTGAGFPGIIAAILCPATQVILVENRRLRIDWLHRVITQMELRNCAVFAGNARAIPLSKADIISARAFAALNTTLAIAGRFSTDQTLWLLPKGRSARQELHLLPPALQKKFTMVPSITDRDANILIGHGKMVVAQ